MGGSAVIEVYDSLTRRMVELVPRVPEHVSIYTCGVTPYDQTHLGHARPAVVWDAVRRHLRRRGYIVTFVQNFTDVDDKIIRRSAELGTSVESLAQQYMAEYLKVMEKLGVEPPDYAPRVTGNMDAIIAYIEDLVSRGRAYAVDGSVYFRVKSDPEYGRLSGRRLEDMLEGVRIDLEPEKEYPADFALWKKADAGEPAWASPWGAGRPGWHIECSAMSMRYLGPHFDLHGGGMDLLFPHHENERAQSRARLGQEPVSIWAHSGMVTRGEVKMSKSLKNGVPLREILDRFSASVVRTYLLSVHYRSPLDFDEARLTEWGHGLQRIYRLWDDVQAASPAAQAPEEEWARQLAEFEERFLMALDQDFNTARAFAEVFEMVRAAYRGIELGHRHLAHGLARRNLIMADEILGFLERPAAGDHEDPDPTAAELLRRRDAARDQRNFALSDELRDLLIAAGYEVLDSPEGTRLRRIKPRAGGTS